MVSKPIILWSNEPRMKINSEKQTEPKNTHLNIDIELEEGYYNKTKGEVYDTILILIFKGIQLTKYLDLKSRTTIASLPYKFY